MRARPSITILVSAAVLAVGPIGVAAAAAATATGSGAKHPAPTRPAPAPKVPVALRVTAAQAVPTTLAPPPPNPHDPSDFIAPVPEGHVISRYGWRDGRRHEGIDVKGPYRTNVFATFDGTVVQAGPGLSGYGYTV